MKKYAIITALVLTVGIVASQAMAWGPGGGPGQGGRGCYAQNQTPEQTEAFEKFMNETTDLRNKLHADHAEMRALMQQQNPDPKQARTLAESMAATKDQLRAKAREHGVSAPGYGRGSGPGDCPRWDGNGGRGGRGGKGGYGPRS
jgi:Spy/CpxP family protein refolding chaperone